MASFNFNETLRTIINNYFGTGTFKLMLVTAVPSEANKDAWDFRDDVTNEVANGNGYTTGGTTVTLTVADDDDTNNDVEVSIDGTPNWPSATFSAVGAILYKSVGSAATDPVISFIDFGGTITATNGTFTYTPSGPLKFQN